MCNRHAIRANVNKASKQAKRGEGNVCHSNVFYTVRGMWERKLCLHTGLNRTFTISKFNLNLQYFCLIEIWKSEVQGWNLSKIFGILTSGFGHNKIASNESWNTETKKTDWNLPTINEKSMTVLACSIERVFPKRSSKIKDWTEKPKIPSKFAKRAARYNEFGYNSY